MKKTKEHTSIRTRVLLALLVTGLVPLVCVFVSLNVSAVGSTAHGHLIPLLVAAALTLAVVYLVGAILSIRLTRPITRAAAVAREVSRGNMDAVIPEDGPPEIRHLAKTFNTMVNRAKHSQERLETLVEERTVRLLESQRQLEQLAAELRAAFESMTDGIFMLEWPSLKIIAANQSFGSLFGIDSASLLGRGAQDLAARIRDHFVEPWVTDMFRCEYFRNHPDEVGVEEWEMGKPKRMTLSVYTAPAVGAHDRVFARLWIFRDLTPQRQLEEELRQAQKMEAIGRLAGGIAHDFNNLLTGIIGNLSMTEMTMQPGAEPARFAAAAKQAAQRAAELVNQLLGFSRRGRLQLKVSNANAVLSEVHQLLRHTVDPRIEIRLELQDGLWNVAADTTQLQQVLMNLCVNAMDAMPNGGRLTLTTSNVLMEAEDVRQRMDAHPGEYVRITVQDVGHGMTQETQSHLFEPFFTTKEPGKGTGLGLAMSYGIIKQHGGWITCFSEVNRGTTFCIYLPCVHVSAEETRPAEVPLAARGGSERLLLVDDEPAVLSVMQSILQRYGYTAVLAANGEEALQTLSQELEDIDLVILDLTMPKLSGRETFRKIREMTLDLPVIISSGYPIEMSVFASETGHPAEGFIQKPYEAAVLARQARAVLDARKKAPTA